LTELVTRDGWLMPAAVNPKLFAQWIGEAVEHLDLVMPFLKSRRCSIQAGGNMGLYPRMLVERYGFEHVVTFEPDATNLRCLSANTEPVADKVTVLGVGLGAGAGKVPWSRASEHKPGWHKIAPNGCRPKHVSGEIELVAIDNVCLPADHEDVDFLSLDIEGYELEALKGAEQTIARCRPVVLFEDMGRSRFEGFRKRSTVAYGNPPGAVQRWLAERGYAKVAEVKNDEVWAIC
jgi:FkbM family methyltransferase